MLSTTGLNCLPGYRPWSPGIGIQTFKSTAWIMWEGGFCKLKNSEVGMAGMGKMKAIVESCFAMEIPGPERPLLGNEGSSQGREARESVLTNYDISSLVVDRLCDQAMGQNTAVTCFYFDFAAQKEQSVTSMLGSLVKQVVRGIDKVPEEVSRAFEEQQLAIGGREPQLPHIVKMLQAITSSLRTFICINALDECVAVHRVKLLNSLK